MPIIALGEARTATQRPSRARHKSVGTRLNEHEKARFEALVSRRKTTESEFIRQLILTELQKENGVLKADPLLAEIVGIRILLVNLLKPLVTGQSAMTLPTFESLLEEVRKAKGKVAGELQRDAMGAAGR